MVKSLFTFCIVRTMILPPLQSVNNDFTTTTKFEQWFYQHFTKCEQWYYQHFVKCEQWFYQQLEFYLLFLQLLQFSTMWILWDWKCEYWFSTSLMLQNSWNHSSSTRDFKIFEALVMWKIQYSHFLLTVFSHCWKLQHFLLWNNYLCNTTSK